MYEKVENVQKVEVKKVEINLNYQPEIKRVEPEIKGTFTYDELLEYHGKDEFGSINKNNLPEDYKNALNIANTAYDVVYQYGKLEGDNLVAENKDYRIILDQSVVNEEIPPEITVISQEEKQPILEVKNYIISHLSQEMDQRFDYQFSQQDLNKFKEYYHNLAQQKHQEMEH